MWLNIDENYECHINGIVRNKNTLRELKTWIAGHGYLYTRCGGAKSKKCGVHRVVAELFLPAPTELDLEVDHIDRNKLNNHASNLRWVPRKINALNKGYETRVRKSKLNEKYITEEKYNCYRLQIVNQYIKHYSFHKDLDTAKKCRDELVKCLINYYGFQEVTK